jgi:hypothetical protein
MPRVALTARNKIDNAVTDEARKYKGWLAEHDIPLKRIAELTGVTVRTVQKQFQNKRLTPETSKAVELLMEGKL